MRKRKYPTRVILLEGGYYVDDDTVSKHPKDAKRFESTAEVYAKVEELQEKGHKPSIHFSSPSLAKLY